MLTASYSPSAIHAAARTFPTRAALRHLVELVDSCKSGFVCFGLDRSDEWDVKVIVDAKEMRGATARVMKRNQIPADRSEDLR